MSEYSGQQQQAVLAALESAAAILIRLDIGPASREALAKWQAGDAEAKAKAADAFAPFTEVLQMQAVLGQGNAEAVYRDLCRSGALSGEKTTARQEIARECDAFLVAEYADLAAGQQNVAPLAFGTRFSDSLGNRPQIGDQVENLVAQAAQGNRQGVKNVFLSCAEASQREAVKEVLHHITALDQDIRNLEQAGGYSLNKPGFRPF